MSIDLTPKELPPVNIIPIDEDAAKVIEIQKLEQNIPYCENHHRNVWTDGYRRVLICRDCGKAIEAFDYMVQWANDADQRQTGLATINTKCKIAQAEFSELDRRVTNLRATLKRLGHPQPDVERNSYRHELLNAHYQRRPHLHRA